MRNTVWFLFFLAICSFTQCSKGSVDNLLNLMVQLNKKTGKDVYQIEILVSEVQKALNTVADKNSEKNSKFDENCRNGNALWKNSIEKLNAELNSLNLSKQKEELIVEDSKKALAKYQEVENTFKENISNTVTDLNKSYKNYEIIAKEAEEKLVVIKAVSDIIVDELLVDNKAKSFVQLKSKTFNMALNNFKDLLPKISAKESLYSSMLTTLISVAETKGFSDQNLLKKILEILAKLEQNIRDFRKKQDVEQKEIIKNLRSMLETQKKELTNNRSSIKEALSVIDGASKIFGEINANIELVNKTIERKSNESKYWDNLCQYQSKIRIEDEQWNRKISQKLDEFKVVSAN